MPLRGSQMPGMEFPARPSDKISGTDGFDKRNQSLSALFLSVSVCEPRSGIGVHL
ncbi:MAG TPA: hypothetical protein VN809_14490 [Telmatospirillum sp.]|nr:hypothetical protein [Telmatospirillum sp.]